MLQDRLKNFGLNDTSLQDLEKYKKMVLDFNTYTNLTSITDDDEFNVKHLLDCLSIMKSGYVKNSNTIIDVGTGAGFPGMVLKLYDKSLKLTLLDSLNKRIRFLNSVADEFALTDVNTIHGRAEEIARGDLRESFDIATSRAVANLRTLLEYVLPFVKINGYFIAMKGPEYVDELKESTNALKKLGGEVVEIIEVALPMDINHFLIIVKKVSSTPKVYPRSGGKPKNKPL